MPPALLASPQKRGSRPETPTAFTPAASIRAVEETLKGSRPGALSPAAAFGVDFAFTIQETKRIDPR